MTTPNTNFQVTTSTSLNQLESNILQSLLLEAFGGDFSSHDWQHTFGGTRFVARLNDTIIAHAAVIARPMLIDGTEKVVGYVEGLGVAPNFQGQGFGKALMREVTNFCLEHFQVAMLSTDEHSFYRQLGWQEFLGQSYVLQEGDEVRSADEDQGLMFLSRQPDSYVYARITCQARAGDAW